MSNPTATKTTVRDLFAGARVWAKVDGYGRMWLAKPNADGAELVELDTFQAYINDAGYTSRTRFVLETTDGRPFGDNPLPGTRVAWVDAEQLAEIARLTEAGRAQAEARRTPAVPTVVAADLAKAAAIRESEAMWNAPNLVHIPRGANPMEFMQATAWQVGHSPACCQFVDFDGERTPLTAEAFEWTRAVACDWAEAEEQEAYFAEMLNMTADTQPLETDARAIRWGAIMGLIRIAGFRFTREDFNGSELVYVEAGPFRVEVSSLGVQRAGDGVRDHVESLRGWTPEAMVGDVLTYIRAVVADETSRARLAWLPNEGMRWEAIQAALAEAGIASTLEHTGGNVHVLYCAGNGFRVGVSDLGVVRETVEAQADNGTTYTRAFDDDWAEVDEEATLAELVELVRDVIDGYECPVCGVDTAGLATQVWHHVSAGDVTLAATSCSEACSAIVEQTRSTFSGRISDIVLTSYRQARRPDAWAQNGTDRDEGFYAIPSVGVPVRVRIVTAPDMVIVRYPLDNATDGAAVLATFTRLDEARKSLDAMAETFAGNGAVIATEREAWDAVLALAEVPTATLTA